MAIDVIDSLEAMQEKRRTLREKGRSVAFVPTMGYLHEGHRTLMRQARGLASHVVASIFVNPTQFGAGEDLDRYPRDMKGDLAACEDEGVDTVFAPGTTDVLYPPGYDTWVTVEKTTEHLCGASRPTHFRGVTTIVLKLFNLVQPTRAIFGEKDYQQLTAIRRMVKDLHLDIEVVGVPTVREDDGLALSSRNAYLGDDARKRALALFEGLTRAQAAFAKGERKAGILREQALAELEGKVDRIDYVEVADHETCVPLDPDAEATADTRLLVAAFMEGEQGTTRLIDNCRLGGERGF